MGDDQLKKNIQNLRKRIQKAAIQGDFKLESGDFSLPKNFTPNEIKVYQRGSDGTSHVTFSNERDKNGKVLGDQDERGHTIFDSFGRIIYVRTQKGNVKKDIKD